MSVSFLKHYYNFSETFNVLLRSISGTGKVDGVIIIFNIPIFKRWYLRKYAADFVDICSTYADEIVLIIMV